MATLFNILNPSKECIIAERIAFIWMDIASACGIGPNKIIAGVCGITSPKEYASKLVTTLKDNGTLVKDFCIALEQHPLFDKYGLKDVILALQHNTKILCLSNPAPITKSNRTGKRLIDYISTPSEGRLARAIAPVWESIASDSGINPDRITMRVHANAEPIDYASKLVTILCQGGYSIEVVCSALEHNNLKDVVDNLRYRK